MDLEYLIPRGAKGPFVAVHGIPPAASADDVEAGLAAAGFPAKVPPTPRALGAARRIGPAICCYCRFAAPRTLGRPPRAGSGLALAAPIGPDACRAEQLPA